MVMCSRRGPAHLVIDLIAALALELVALVAVELRELLLHDLPLDSGGGAARHCRLQVLSE